MQPRRAEYLALHGQTSAVLGEVVSAFRRHAAHNPVAVFREQVSAQDVLRSATVCEPITRLQCCAPTCGAAAVILSSHDFAHRRGLLARVSRPSGDRGWPRTCRPPSNPVRRWP
jgi:acetyl-CoA acetyltransferase